MTTNSAFCVVCGLKLVKNGRTAAGTQRWRCASCGASSVRSRPDLARTHDLAAFVAWLLSNTTQADASTATTGRSFRARTAWCWRVEPSIAITGEIYPEIQLDGFHLRTGWCLLVAIARGHPIAWQWAGSENAPAWSALLAQLPAPRVVISDGGSGLAAALTEHWSDTRTQRCLVHVQRNVRRFVTSRAKTPAGKALWALALKLTRIRTIDEAISWVTLVNDWHQQYGHLTRERTYARSGATAPAWARPNQTWWYTHQRLRSGYQVLQRRISAGDLFTYLADDLASLNICSTTNRIEGGINAALRDLLRRHRGMNAEHQKRALEWWLQQHSEHAANPATFIRPEHHTPAARQAPAPDTDEPIGPATYDTGLSPDEGLWIRKGQAGRP